MRGIWTSKTGYVCRCSNFFKAIGNCEKKVPVPPAASSRGGIGLFSRSHVKVAVCDNNRQLLRSFDLSIFSMCSRLYKYFMDLSQDSQSIAEHTYTQFMHISSRDLLTGSLNFYCLTSRRNGSL